MNTVQTQTVDNVEDCLFILRSAIVGPRIKSTISVSEILFAINPETLII